MGPIRLLLVAVVTVASSMLFAAPASAQATRTWIAGDGNDVNPCSRDAPCKTFAGAISKTAAGGEINCLNPGGLGAVTITKSISLICDNNQEAGIVVSGTSAIIINSTTAFVVLNGLDLEGLGNSVATAGIHGVNIVNAAVVHIRNTKIRGFRNGYGINFAPQNGSSHLFVDNVTISESGAVASPSTSGGLNINPAAGFTGNATITNTHIADNANVGIRVDTTGIVGSSITASIENCVISHNDNGILVKAPNGTGTIRFLLNDSIVSLNSVNGIIVNGTPASATARVGDTTINANATGILALGTAQIFSYGNNRLDANTADGAFTGTIPLH